MLCPNHSCCFVKDDDGPSPFLLKNPNTDGVPGIWSLQDELLVQCIESCPFEQNLTLRRVCRRFNYVVVREPMFCTNRKFIDGVTNYRTERTKFDLEHETSRGDSREDRGRFRLNMLILVNVLLGMAQLGVAGATIGKDCEKPLAPILFICGTVNFIQVVSFSLWGCSEETLHPLDEYGDEEFGWPLYLVGLVVWLSFICDFTLWIVMQMLFSWDLQCDDTLRNTTLSTILVRWIMVLLYVGISVHHLMDKIHQETKRKFGRNPFKRHKTGKAFMAALGQTGAADDESEERLQQDSSPRSAGNVTIDMGASGGSRSEHTRAGTTVL